MLPRLKKIKNLLCPPESRSSCQLIKIMGSLMSMLKHKGPFFPHTQIHKSLIIHSLLNKLNSYLENMPRDETPITSLLMLHLVTSSTIAFTISSDSICETSTCICKWKNYEVSLLIYELRDLFKNHLIPNLSLSTHILVRK